MRADVNATLLLTAATAAGETSSVLVDAFPARLLSLVLVGAALGLLGGAGAALFPWGRDPKWGWWPALKALGLGILVGSMASIASAALNLDDPVRWVVTVVSALLAQKLLDHLSKTSVNTLVGWISRRAAVEPRSDIDGEASRDA